MGRKIVKEESNSVVTTDLPESISEDQVKDVMQVLKEAREQSEDLKVLASLPSNNGVEEHAPEDGEEAVATVVTNTATGERSVVGVTSIPDYLAEVDKEIDAKRALEPVEVTEEPISKEVVEDFTKKNAFFENVNMDDAEILQLMNVVHRVQRKEKFNIYKALPLSIQNEVDRFAAANGYGGLSVEAKTGKNAAAEFLVESFVAEMSISQGVMDLNNELSKIMGEMNLAGVGFSIEYAKEREKILEKYIEEHPDNVEQIESLKNILKAIDDAYTLSPLILAAKEHKIGRIKKIELEKPKKIVDRFLAKYLDNPQYNIYSVYDAMKVLYRKTKNDLSENDIYLFFIAFCKYCKNFKPEIPVENAFMYYVPYNCIMLDGCVGEYEEYGNVFVNNVKEVINALKSN